MEKKLKKFHILSTARKLIYSHFLHISNKNEFISLQFYPPQELDQLNKFLLIPLIFIVPHFFCQSFSFIESNSQTRQRQINLKLKLMQILILTKLEDDQAINFVWNII